MAGHYGLVFVLSRNLNPARRRVSPVEARRELVDQVRQGRTITDALIFVGRSRSWYDGQRRDEPDFAVLIDSVRLRKTDIVDANKSSNIGFSEFSEKFLKAKVWPHMQNTVDLLEGRSPDWIVDGMVFEPVILLDWLLDLNSFLPKQLVAS